MVEQAHVVGTRPGATRLDRLERRHAMGERRPDEVFEEGSEGDVEFQCVHLQGSEEGAP
jgi:hypothetical protein